MDLTQNDLKKIYKKLIVSQWWLDHHMELFGWKKLCDEKTGASMGYGSGGIETISRNIYDNLSWISCSENGKPHRDEPDYGLIKKIR